MSVWLCARRAWCAHVGSIVGSLERIVPCVDHTDQCVYREFGCGGGAL